MLLLGVGVALWSYSLVLLRDLAWWRDALALALLPVLVWSATQVATILANPRPEPERGWDEGDLERAARLPIWTALAVLASLALLVSTG